jgi:muconolactone delta-isomerase
MENFMVSILVSGIDNKTMEKLRPEEGKILMKWAANGTLKSAFVRQDLGGAFLILRAKNETHVEGLMKTLPMFPYMKLEITPLETSPFMMRVMLGIFLRIGSIVNLFK